MNEMVPKGWIMRDIYIYIYIKEKKKIKLLKFEN